MRQLFRMDDDIFTCVNWSSKFNTVDVFVSHLQKVVPSYL